MMHISPLPLRNETKLFLRYHDFGLDLYIIGMMEIYICICLSVVHFYTLLRRELYYVRMSIGRVRKKTVHILKI